MEITPSAATLFWERSQRLALAAAVVALSWAKSSAIRSLLGGGTQPGGNSSHKQKAPSSVKAETAAFAASAISFTSFKELRLSLVD